MIKKAEIKSEKDRILVVLTGTNRNMSPSEINRSIGGYLKPHTIRDRLKDLVSDGKIIKTGDKRGTKYQIAKEQGRVIRAALPELEPETHREGTFSISQPAKEVYKYVTSPLLDRINVGYQRVFLDEYQPNITSYLTEEDKTTLLALGQVENHALGDGRLTQKIKDRLLTDIAFNSSRLDGNTYSLLDSERLLGDETSTEGKTATETQMLLNYQRAIEFLFEPNEQIRLNRFVLINLHAYLSEGLLGSPAAEGRLRTRAMRVDIAQSVYIPTSIPHVIEECFESILTKAQLIENPFEQAFFLLVQIPYLQPFEDVSKRVSRLAELADVALLRDVFLWGYRRSAMHNRAIRTSLGAPEPISLRYRALITNSVRELVESKTGKALVKPAIAWLLGKDIDPNEREELARQVEQQLLDLHEGNIERFDITRDDFDQWKSNWEE
jgi:hypothetical protein